jgi:hypothetical protein
MNNFFNIRSYDENFEFLAKIKLEKRPHACGVNEENLFILNKNEKCCIISMYNHNLEMIQTFGQEDSMLPFYFSHDIIFFLTSDQYFISFKKHYFNL